MGTTARSSKGAGAATSGRAVPIEMPRMSSDEGTATLSAWLVAVGDAVEKGAIVAELETDKATVELEAPVEGRIEALLVSAGTEGLKPGALLGRIAPTAALASPDADTPDADSPETPAPVPAPAVRAPQPPVAPDSAKSEVAPLRPAGDAARSPATPLARRVAESRGIDLERVTGTGVGGRIEKADVERSGSAPAVRAATPMRVDPAVAEGPRAGAQLGLRCRVDAIEVARARLNGPRAAGSPVERITFNDFVVRAAALALRDLPAANRRRAADARGAGTGSEAAEAIDVALVAATASGPRTLVIRDADRKGLAVLSAEIRGQVEAARGGAADADPGTRDEAAASLLVTSLGRFGIETAQPLLPAGQVCVLAVGAVGDEPVVEEGVLAVGKRVHLTLAFDPAAFGGAVAAELLAGIRRHLEDPLRMML